MDMGVLNMSTIRSESSPKLLRKSAEKLASNSGVPAPPKMGNDVFFEIHNPNRPGILVLRLGVGQHSNDILIDKQFFTMKVVVQKDSIEDLLDDCYFVGSVFN